MCLNNIDVLVLRHFCLLLLAVCTLGFAPKVAAASAILEKYDHEMHENKVFKENKIECSYCHNFEFSGKSYKAKLKSDIDKSTFVKPMKELCHSCHNNAETRFPKAPQTCFTCHRTLENLKSIKPQNHYGVDWNHNHSLNARVSDDSCVNCHSTSQCVKCHVGRDTVFQQNHSRNFRFYHSIEARFEPHKCDTCHTKNYCMNCHLGGR